MITLINKEQLPALNQVDFSQKSHAALVQYCEDLRYTLNLKFEQHHLTSQNSSLSSSMLLPWQQQKVANEPTFIETQKNIEPLVTPDTSGPKNKANSRKKRDQGYGRTQILETQNTVLLHATVCACCQTEFSLSDHRCYRAFYQVELERRSGEATEYIVVQTKYKLHDSVCQHCQQTTRTSLPRIQTDIEGVTLSSQGLIGPQLASELIDFHKHDGTSIRKLQRKIMRLFGISLSTGAITQAINHGGICCEKQVEHYRLEAEQAELAHMDETTWKDGGNRLYLWVIVTSTVCLFSIGRRTKEMANTFLHQFSGWLMTDGYAVYREYKKRFRCHSHLTRKATACQDSAIAEAKTFGAQLLALLKKCHDAVYTARKLDIKTSIKDQLTATLSEIEMLCNAHRDSKHPKTKALA
ncbi:hypothetical protein BOW02_12430, partial [Solemya velum gill symbiont]|uniref:IS66 family transposase n=1 Tax=Solemya velum gill symbiont TaxID=2340 RepID=UPI0009976C7A